MEYSSSIHLDKIIMERIASASQEKVYPSVQPKSEVPLRKVLLSSRIWECVRNEEERLTAEIASATSEEDWWFDNNPTTATVDDETLDALVSFASNANDNSTVVDYSNNNFLPTNTTTNTANGEEESISGDWSWLEEESKLMSNSQDVLSHTNSFIDLASLKEQHEITEEEKLIAALINTTDNHEFLLPNNTLPSPPEEEHDMKTLEENNEEEWLAIPIAVSTTDVSTKEASTISISTLEASTINISTKEASTINVSTKELSTINVSTKELSTINVSTKEFSTTEASTMEGSITEVTPNESSITKASINEPSITEDPVNDAYTAEISNNDVCVMDVCTKDPSTGVKRHREDDDDQEQDIKPTKKQLVDTKTTKSYPAGPDPSSPIASSLLRV